MEIVRDQTSVREARAAVVPVADPTTVADLTGAAAGIGIGMVIVTVPSPRTGDRRVGGAGMIEEVEIVSRSSVVNGPREDDSKRPRLPRPVVPRDLLGRATGTTCSIRIPRSTHAAYSRMPVSSAIRRNQMRSC